MNTICWFTSCKTCNYFPRNKNPLFDRIDLSIMRVWNLRTIFSDQNMSLVLRNVANPFEVYVESFSLWVAVGFRTEQIIISTCFLPPLCVSSYFRSISKLSLTLVNLYSRESKCYAWSYNWVSFFFANVPWICGSPGIQLELKMPYLLSDLDFSTISSWFLRYVFVRSIRVCFEILMLSFLYKWINLSHFYKSENVTIYDNYLCVAIKVKWKGFDVKEQYLKGLKC